DLIEVEAQGRWRWAEIFAADRLGDAVVRLYERYADLLPDGPARDRAAATARSVAALPLVGAHDLDRLDRSAWVFAPAIEYVDHRTVGMGSVHGAEAVERAVRALLELMEDSATRLDDILALRSDAFLARWTHFGTDRASGGASERRLCPLLSAQDATLLHEPLATLGDSLALCRVSTSASGFAGGTFDVGAYEREQIILVEVDAHGRGQQSELFAADRLGDAVVRLYERYADLFPDGPART